MVVTHADLLEWVFAVGNLHPPKGHNLSAIAASFYQSHRVRSVSVGDVVLFHNDAGAVVAAYRCASVGWVDVLAEVGAPGRLCDASQTAAWRSAMLRHNLADIATEWLLVHARRAAAAV